MNEKNDKNDKNKNGDDGLEVSFMLSRDELYTLVLLSGEPTEAGKYFISEALAGASPDDLSGLIEKKMAHGHGEKIVVEPVIRMLGASICKAEKIDFINLGNESGGTYVVCSPWIKIRCEPYPRIENCLKLTPEKPDE